MKGLGRILGVLAVFVLVGPPLGALGLLPIVAVFSILREPADAASQLLAMLVLTPFAMIGSWWFGFVPAALTGLVGAIASPWLRDGRVWILTLAALGALAAFAFPLTFLGHEIGTEGLSGRLFLAIPGSLGGAACAWITRRFRPGKAAREAR